MTIFKYEMKRNIKYILVWALAMAVCIFMMTPTYYSFMEMAESNNSMYETLGNSDFFKSVGVSMGYLMTPLGIYSFLTSFFMIASGIFGVHFGITTHTKEFTEKTSEYLYTKPHTRKEIFWSKAGTVFLGTFIVGSVYMAVSGFTLVIFRSGTGISWKEFFLISASLLWLTLFFAAMGLLIGTFFSNNKNPLLTSGLVIFVEYCITSFSNVISNKGIGFLSPFSFFTASEISQNGFYESAYVIWYLLVFAVFMLMAYRHFIKKDMQFRS